jgi:hypothetical protein
LPIAILHGSRVAASTGTSTLKRLSRSPPTSINVGDLARVDIRDHVEAQLTE